MYQKCNPKEMQSIFFGAHHNWKEKGLYNEINGFVLQQIKTLSFIVDMQWISWSGIRKMDALACQGNTKCERERKMFVC